LDREDEVMRLRAFLHSNRAAPIVRPVLLSLTPVRNTGTFEGLAPLLTAFGELSFKEQLALAGFRRFALCVFFGEADTGTLALAQETAPHLVFCDGEASNLRNPATGECASLEALLREAQVEPEVSIVIVPPEYGEMSLDALAHMQKFSGLSFELLLPAEVADQCMGYLENVRPVPHPSPEAYRVAAIREARGEFVWFCPPDAQPSAKVLNSLCSALWARESIACARYYGTDGPQGNDCVPHVLGEYTCGLDGNELLHRAGVLNLPLIPSEAHILFRRSALLALPLEELCRNDNFVTLLAREAHKNKLVAVVPGEWTNEHA
jgi:hypothetical protein